MEKFMVEMTIKQLLGIYFLGIVTGQLALIAIGALFANKLKNPK
jgi:hypothetical protein